ncbi:MAG: WbqC family protein [Bacteroides sp.]|nr:WbqC family protein [Bacteroides sp.]
MIPFAASASRYSDWLRILLSGNAEQSFPSIGGKEQARVMIDGGIMLGVPVTGGGSRLKRNCGEEVMISDHGRWPDVHLGAIKAIYGKTPYFPYLFPELERIYKEYGGGSLEKFNLAIHNLILRWLGLADESFLTELRQLSSEKKDIILRLAMENSRNIDMNHSILGLLFRLGKESVFTLI